METKTKYIKNSGSYVQNKHSNPKKELRIHKEKINWSKQAKYLGVIIDKNLNLKNNTYETVNKSKRVRAALYPILNRNSRIPLPSRIIIMKIYIKTILTNATEAWGPFLKQSSCTKCLYKNHHWSSLLNIQCKPQNVHRYTFITSRS